MDTIFNNKSAVYMYTSYLNSPITRLFSPKFFF